MLCGRSPWGLGGAVYLLVARSHLFVRRCERSLMLSIGGRGMLLSAMYPCWIVQVPWIGEQRSSRRIVESQQ
jgi:hypothetical protein